MASYPWPIMTLHSVYSCCSNLCILSLTFSKIVLSHAQWKKYISNILEAFHHLYEVVNFHDCTFKFTIIPNQCFNWPPKKRHRILWKTKVMTQGSTTWTSIRGQEIPMMGEKLLKYDLNIVDLQELKWSEVNCLELNCELNWIWYNVHVIGHCLSANWHRWFNSLCRNWDWNSKSDGCAKVRRSGLCSGHMILPFMSFSFYEGIFKRIFRFLAFLEELAINEDGMAVCMGWFTSLTGATLCGTAMQRRSSIFMEPQPPRMWWDMSWAKY